MKNKGMIQRSEPPIVHTTAKFIIEWKSYKLLYLCNCGQQAGR